MPFKNVVSTHTYIIKKDSVNAWWNYMKANRETCKLTQECWLRLLHKTFGTRLTVLLEMQWILFGKTLQLNSKNNGVKDLKYFSSQTNFKSTLTNKKKLWWKNLENSASKSKTIHSTVFKLSETIAFCPFKNGDDRTGWQINEKSFALQLSSWTQDIFLLKYACP